MSHSKEQFDRVKRMLLRIENQDRGSNEYDDDLWSFFQNCWHLKDWIKNDSYLAPKISENIEQEVKAYEAIMICADLANRSKHLKLNNKRRGAQVVQRNVTIKMKSPIHSTEETICSSECCHVISLDDGSTLVALDVAKQAVNEWEKIFRKYNIST